MKLCISTATIALVNKNLLELHFKCRFGDIPRFPRSLQIAGNPHCPNHFQKPHPQAAGLPIVDIFEMVGMIQDVFLNFPEQICCAIANALPETRQQPAVQHFYRPGVGRVLGVSAEALRRL